MLGPALRSAGYDRSTPAALAWIAAYSIAGSLLCGLVFLVIHHASLSATDAAAGTPLLDVLDDPFARSVWRTGVAFSAAAVYLVALTALRGRRIMGTFWRVLAMTLFVIAVATPFAGVLAWPLGVVTVCAALVACRADPGLTADASSD